MARAAKSREKYIVDEKGKRVAVILNIKDYKKLLGDLEELDCTRAYDEAMASGEEAIPFEQAINEIEQRRQRRSGAHQ